MERKLPLLSVIVPIYKVEEYLDECVQSILAQTYRNLEIILVDDGSPDRCGQMCDQYATQDPRIRIIHRKNGGVSAARNSALDVHQGDYVTFIDSDDLYPDTHMLEHFMSILSDNPEIEMLSYPLGFYPDGYVIVTHEDGIIKGAELNYKNQISRKYGDEACNKIFKRSLIQGLRFDEDITIGEDLLFSLLVAKRLEVAYVCNRYHYYYRQRQGSAIHSYMPLTKAKEFLYINLQVIRLQAEAFPAPDLTASNRAYYALDLFLAGYSGPQSEVAELVNELVPYFRWGTLRSKLRSRMLSTMAIIIYLYVNRRLGVALYRCKSWAMQKLLRH